METVHFRVRSFHSIISERLLLALIEVGKGKLDHLDPLPFGACHITRFSNNSVGYSGQEGSLVLSSNEVRHSYLGLSFVVTWTKNLQDGLNLGTIDVSARLIVLGTHGAKAQAHSAEEQ